MKTKLLLFIALFSSAVSFSQITFSNLTTTAITETSATVNVTLNSCSAGANIVLQVAQSTAYSPMLVTQSISGVSAPGTTTYTITGLTSGTTYFWRFYGNFITGSGCNSSTEYSANASFRTLPTLIVEYNFNNTYNDINGNFPFSSNAGTSFATGRDGTANGAINIANTGSTAAVNGLPIGNLVPSTVSFWAKFNTVASINYMYAFGQSSFYNSVYITSNAIAATGDGGVHSVSSTTVADTWNHYVFVYDGVNSIIYKDGILLGSLARSWQLASSPLLRLGASQNNGVIGFDGAIDDFKIYNNAISQAQVTNLFTNNSLTSQNFNQNNLEVSLYPNPANAVLNIEMTNEVKSIEIYNIQGQKVLESSQKQINVSDLASGMYMVKIQDAENSITTKKVIIK